jgi:hypothetical protein
MSVVHHMLLYLCPNEPLARRPAQRSQSCMLKRPPAQVSQATGVLPLMHRRCADGEVLAYGWGRNAAPLVLPPGVGFEVGPESFTHAVLEARTAVPLQPCQRH